MNDDKKKDSPFKMLVDQAINNASKSPLKPKKEEREFGAPKKDKASSEAAARARRPEQQMPAAKSVPANKPRQARESSNPDRPPSIHELMEAKKAQQSSQALPPHKRSGGKKTISSEEFLRILDEEFDKFKKSLMNRLK